MVTPLTDASSERQPSRRMARRLLEEEAYRRIAAGEAPQRLSDLAAQLSAWFSATYPAAPAPLEKFVEEAIRDTWHRRHEIIGSEL